MSCSSSDTRSVAGGFVAPDQVAAGVGVVHQLLAGLGVYLQGTHQVEAGIHELVGSSIALGAEALDDGLHAGAGNVAHHIGSEVNAAH